MMVKEQRRNSIASLKKAIERDNAYILDVDFISRKKGYSIIGLSMPNRKVIVTNEVFEKISDYLRVKTA